MNVCGDVAEYKIATGKAVYDAEREKQKIAAVEEYAHGEFNKEAVREIFSQLMTISRRYQYGLLRKNGKVSPIDFTMPTGPESSFALTFPVTNIFKLSNVVHIQYLSS